MSISPQPITEEEFKQVINEIFKIKPYCKNVDKQLFLNWKHATMLYFHYYLGLRPRSVRLIEIKHINFKNKTLFVPADNVKVRVADTFPIPKQLFDKLMIYLRVRGKFHKGSPYLFCSTRNPFKSQDKNYLGEKFRKLLKKLNISHPNWKDNAGMIRYSKCLYSIRHSYGLRVWNQTKNIKFVAIMLGHHDIMMRHASRYVSMSETEERPEIMKQVWTSETA